MHALAYVAALSYLGLPTDRLKDSGILLSENEITEEFRTLRIATYWIARKRKPRRILEELNKNQLTILHVLGFWVKYGRVLQS